MVSSSKIKLSVKTDQAKIHKEDKVHPLIESLFSNIEDEEDDEEISLVSHIKEVKEEKQKEEEKIFFEFAKKVGLVKEDVKENKQPKQTKEDIKTLIKEEIAKNTDSQPSKDNRHIGYSIFNRDAFIRNVDVRNGGVGSSLISSVDSRNSFSLRGLIAGTDIGLTSTSGDIRISYTGSAASNGISASNGENLGTGHGIYQGNTDNDTLRFRTLSGGLNVLLQSGSNFITINAEAPYTEITGNLSASITDYTINLTANNATVWLPTTSGRIAKIFVFKLSSSGSVMTVQGAGSEKIDGNDTMTLNVVNEARKIQSTGQNWIII